MTDQKMTGSDLLDIYTDLKMNGEQIEGQIRFISSQSMLINGFCLEWIDLLSQKALQVFYDILKRDENANQENLEYILEKIM